jgi:membrane protein
MPGQAGANGRVEVVLEDSAVSPFTLARRIDDDISLRLGLDPKAAGIMDYLFTNASATLTVATVTSLVFLVFGTVAVASSLQQIYEKVFGQDHHGGLAGPVAPADLDRGPGWRGGDGKPGRTAGQRRRRRRLAGPLVTIGIMTPFFWWTMHFLLAGRVAWRTLLPSALITGVFYGGLGVFSTFYFSDAITSDSKTYGTIGAIFGIMTWFIAIGAVIILGAVAGAVWEDRRN